jgi:hypothetical protein
LFEVVSQSKPQQQTFFVNQQPSNQGNFVSRPVQATNQNNNGGQFFNQGSQSRPVNQVVQQQPNFVNQVQQSNNQGNQVNSGGQWVRVPVSNNQARPQQQTFTNQGQQSAFGSNNQGNNGGQFQQQSNFGNQGFQQPITQRPTTWFTQPTQRPTTWFTQPTQHFVPTVHTTFATTTQRSSTNNQLKKDVDYEY